MISSKEKMIESVSSRILLFCANNKSLAKFNYNNGTVSAEDFFAEFFNILYRDSGCNFFNTNKDKSNYPGIDLLDLDNKKAVQVTIENSLKKVSGTFDVIPKINENKLYTKLDFVIQDSKITKGMKNFGPVYQGYDVNVICIADILRDVNNLNKLNHVEDVCRFVEKAIKIPDKAVAEMQVDNEAFEILFQALKDQVIKVDVENEKDPIVVYRSSTKEKKNKFKNDWDRLINLYKHTLGMTDTDNGHVKLINYEKRLAECFSQDLNEIQKNLILKYLRVESFLVLEKNSGKPLEAIEELTEKIKIDFNVGFLSKTQVMSFILNMFFTCDVFPLS